MSKLEMEGGFFHLMKVICRKPASNSLCADEC